MVKDAFEGKSLLAVGAAVAFCGAALYATGQVLDLLFRDSRESRSDPVLFKRLKDGSFVIPAVLFHIDAKRVFLHSFTIATAVL